jgi:hypothetical protein
MGELIRKMEIKPGVNISSVTNNGCEAIIAARENLPWT